MKILAGAATVLALTVFSPHTAVAQDLSDADYIALYRGYWQQIQEELRLAGSDCATIASRLNDWSERNGDDIDSLIMHSEGLVDRMTDAQVDAFLPAQEPLLFRIAEVSARCIGVPEYRDAMAAVSLVIGMGS